MKKMNIDEFLGITILENRSAIPGGEGIKFSELVCGDKTRAYSDKVISYIKAPHHTKDSNKVTKKAVCGGDPETTKKLKLLWEHLKLLETICNDQVDDFRITNYESTKNHSYKKSQILLYWILQQYLTWPNKPEYQSLEEVKETLIYFANRVKQNLDSFTRYSLMHVCNPEKFETLEDVANYQKKFARTFAL